MPLFRKGERQGSDCVNFGKRLKEKEKCDETKGRNKRSFPPANGDRSERLSSNFVACATKDGECKV